MADKPRKPLTPEQREQKNARDRARYHARREGGLSAEEARLAVPKLLERRPELKSDEGFLSRLGGAVLRTLDKIGETVTGEASTIARPEPGPERGTSRETPKETSRAKSPRTKGKGKKRAGETRSTTRGQENADAFAAFVESHPGLGKNETVRKFKEAGGSIGNDRANDIWRRVNQRELEPKKVTKITYHKNGEIVTYDDKQKNYLGDGRYIYVMRFRVGAADGSYEQPEYEYVTIVEDEKLIFADLLDITEQYWNREENGERVYAPLEIIPGSIELMWAVDMKK